MNAINDTAELCPCQSGQNLNQCCGPLLSGDAKAETALALMRSRYSAFALQQVDYLLNTLATDNRQRADREDLARYAADMQWRGLEILAVEEGGERDIKGLVEFCAHYTNLASGQEGLLRERSNFVREQGRWVYLDGDISETDPLLPGKLAKKTGRNEPCPCGSGKKYKKCCL